MNAVGEALALHLSLLGEMADEDRAAIVALPSTIRDLPRSRDVLRPGDRPDHAVIVLDGFLCRHSIGPRGVRQIHSFYLPTDSPCLETLYIDTMDNSLGAVVDSRIGLVPHTALYRLIDERPNVRKLIWRETLVQASIFREWLMRNSVMDAQASVAHLFCEIYMRSRNAGLCDDGHCTFPATQQMIADAIGITSVHINRTVMLLRRSGAVEWRGGKLSIFDWDRLRRMADFRSSYLHFKKPDTAILESWMTASSATHMRND